MRPLDITGEVSVTLVRRTLFNNYVSGSRAKIARRLHASV